MRQFKLINAYGAELDLMSLSYFFHESDGLGWGTSPELSPVGNGYIITKHTANRPVVSGQVSFAGYRSYEMFLSFVQVGGLRLCYKPLDVWRYLDVSVTIGKSDAEHPFGRMNCPVTFTGLSQWYEQAQFYRSASAEGQSKRYSYAYPYTYADGESGSVVVYNGQLSSYPKLTIVGPATNPKWYLYQGDERLASGAVALTLQAGRKLVIDCHPATMELAEYTADGAFGADRYGASDFTTERFFELPPGQCSVQFAHDGAAAITGYVEVRRRV